MEKLKAEYKKLFKLIILVILSVLISSFIFYITMSIMICALNISLHFTYLNSIGIVLLVLNIKFLLGLFIKGIDLKELLEE